MNILLVDDSATVRLLIKNILEEHPDAGSFKFFNAENGQVALDIMEYNDIDVIFIDWHMPVMNGEALTDIIHKDRRLDKVKIIIASAEGHKHKVVKMLRHGVNAYLLKPLDKEALLKTFDSVIKKGH